MCTPNCPTCKAPLHVVRQSPHSMLNAEQFDAVKPGVWFCDRCNDPESHTGRKYWWNRQITESGQEVCNYHLGRE